MCINFASQSSVHPNMSLKLNKWNNIFLHTFIQEKKHLLFAMFLLSKAEFMIIFSQIPVAKEGLALSKPTLTDERTDKINSKSRFVPNDYSLIYNY